MFVNHPRRMRATKDDACVTKSLNWIRRKYKLEHDDAVAAKEAAVARVGEQAAKKLRRQHAHAKRTRKLTGIDTDHPGILVMIATDPCRTVAEKHGISKSWAYVIRTLLIKHAQAMGLSDGEHDLVKVANGLTSKPIDKRT